MKTINCQGHEKPITKLKYNLEGDLLFSIAKDSSPCVWYSINGESLGTYNGHNGAVYGLDVKWDSTKLVTGAADTFSILWDTETGKSLGNSKYKSTVRSVNFNMDGSQILLTTQQQKDEPSSVFLLDVAEIGNDNNCIIKTLKMVGKSNVTGSIWGPLDEYVITTHGDGSICQWDIKNEKCINTAIDHNLEINDIQSSIDMVYFITASSDLCAKLFDMDTLKCLKTYKTNRKVNSAALSPTFEHVALGGGEDVRQVTTSADKGGFETRLYHLIYEEEFAKVPGHFGPINSLAFHPDGKRGSHHNQRMLLPFVSKYP
ncbi:eukaryotic translation initiation factor 3 subunit I-like isoform X2 [Gordionus sp. m RMFG-2023]|uniref:eukaryotic translation initiation factor 3 subunit I-like isoform X2 n=1 Tax=Gordionus sp. m RMFG-2023 TaxID=3053472 RepID=UPI0031FC209F